MEALLETQPGFSLEGVKGFIDQKLYNTYANVKNDDNFTNERTYTIKTQLKIFHIMFYNFTYFYQNKDKPITWN